MKCRESPVNIGIDARLFSDTSTGIGRYTTNLIHALSQIDGQNNYTLFTNRDYEYPLGSNFRLKIIHVKSRTAWNNLFLSRELSAFNITIYHSVAGFEVPVIKRCKRCKYIITVHDLIPLLYPETVPIKHRILFKFFIKRAVEVADVIITDSESSKNDILDRLNLKSEKVRVIYIASDDRFSVIDDQILIDKVKKKYRIHGRYILYIGVIEPRKNIPQLIKAFNILKKNKLIDDDYGLVIAGKRGWYHSQTFKTAEKVGIDSEVLFTDYVPDDDLPILYSGADLFVFPSIYEGFGLPPLEAMACGTPVICSDVSSVPEVVGDAGFLIDPFDLDSLVHGIKIVLDNRDLREDMIQKGFKQAGKFSWEKTARETLKVYEKTCQID